jgi:hypothetical protein
MGEDGARVDHIGTHGVPAAPRCKPMFGHDAIVKSDGDPRILRCGVANAAGFPGRAGRLLIRHGR